MSRAGTWGRAGIWLRIAIATVIALALGGGTAVLVSAVRILRPPIHNASRVFWIGDTVGPRELPPSLAYHILHTPGSPFQAGAYIAGTNRLGSTFLSVHGTLRQVRSIEVTVGLFPIVGCSVRIGRPFSRTDEQPRDAHYHDAVLSWRTWHRLFSAEPSVVGRYFLFYGGQDFNGMPLKITGILAPGCNLPVAADVYLPLMLYPTGSPDGSAVVLVRPRQGNTPAVAQASLQTLLASSHGPGKWPTHLVLYPFLSALLGHLAATLSLIISLAAVALAVALANVAMFSLLTAAQEQRSFALRAALGASPWRLLRYALARLTPVVAVGGGGALLVAWGTLALFRDAAGTAIPTYASPEMTWPIGLGIVALVVCAGLAWLAPGVMAALRAAPAMRISDSLVSKRKLKRRILLGCVAVEILLLVGAAAAGTVSTFRYERLLTNGIGMDLRGVTELQCVLPAHSGETAKSIAERLGLLAGARQRPRVAEALFLPGVPSPVQMELYKVGDPRQSMLVNFYGVSPGYFHTLLIPLLTGADFQPWEAPNEADGGPVIVDRRTARRLRLRVGDLIASGPHAPPGGRVIGIVGNVSGGVGTVPAAYAPLSVWFGPSATSHEFRLLIHASMSPKLTRSILARRLRAIFPTARLGYPMPLKDALPSAFQGHRARAWLGSALGLIVLAEVLVGVCTIGGYVIEMLRPELAIRAVVGASPIRLGLDVATPGLALALPAWAIGIAVSAAFLGLGPGLVAAAAATAGLICLLFLWMVVAAIRISSTPDGLTAIIRQE